VAAIALTVKLRTIRLLLVDDDEALVDALADGLQKRGYRTETYTDPSEALADFSPRLYDIAILDVRMGPIDGMELYRRLKGLDPRIAVCFLTAHADMITERPPGIRFLQKPVSLAELVGALEDIEGSGKGPKS
jgi:DNA-binding response OmpR family regulator